MATNDKRRRPNRGHIIVQAQSGGSETAIATLSTSNNPFCAYFQPRSIAGTSSCEREVQDEGISPLEVYHMFCHCFVFRLIQLTFNLNVNRILASLNFHPTKLRSYMDQEEASDCQNEEASVELVSTCRFSRWMSTAFIGILWFLDAAGRCTYHTSHCL